MEKYKLIKDDFIEVCGKKLYRIMALKDFNNVKEGDKGGYVGSYNNLSQDGNAWIYNNARAYENACIFENAQIRDNAWISMDARVSGNAIICDNARIFENAWISGDARVSERAWVFGNAWVYDNSRIYGYAHICGDAQIKKNARVYGNAIIKYGSLDCDIFENMRKYIACSLNVFPVNGKYILYKRVYKTDKEGVYRSCYNSNFLYKINEYAEVKDYDEDKLISCGKGIHVSTPFYWKEGDTLGGTLIAVEVEEKDIITCMEGKLRVKKVKVLDEIKI